MPKSKRDRQWVSSRAKAAAIEAARRRKNRKRLGAALGLGVLVIAIIGAAAFTGGGGSNVAAKSDASLSPSTTGTTVPTLASAAGKPCVALSDPLPPGAPDVPVKVGPPPATLVIEDLKTGDGAEVVATNTLSVNYIGVSCSTGKIFSSSYEDGQPANFPLSNVIPGWQQGIPGMKIGGQRLLGIPPALAYGPGGRPGIAPDETLWFVIEVLSVT